MVLEIFFKGIEDDDAIVVAAVVVVGALDVLLPLMKHPDPVVLSEICWIMTFLSAKEDACVEVLIRAGLIQVALHLFVVY